MLNPKPTPWVTLFASSSNDTRLFAVRAKDLLPQLFFACAAQYARSYAEICVTIHRHTVPAPEKRDSQKVLFAWIIAPTEQAPQRRFKPRSKTGGCSKNSINKEDLVKGLLI